MTDSTNLIRIFQQVQPDEIYNLVAMSHVAVSFDTTEYTANADGLGTLRILEAIRILGSTSTLPYILRLGSVYKTRGDSGASNAVAENINSQIQAAIVRARGFKSLRSLTNIIFLSTGKLSNLPANPFQNPVTV